MQHSFLIKKNSTNNRFEGSEKNNKHGARY